MSKHTRLPHVASHWLVVLICVGLVGLSSTIYAQNNRVTVEFWHTYPETGPAHAALVNTLIPQFEVAHPGVRVQPVAFPAADFRHTLFSALASGDGPDVARLDVLWVPVLADLDVLMPLDTAMPDYAGYADAIFPGLLAANAYAGHTYGLPVDAQTHALVWNTTLFELANLEGPPARISALPALCATLHDHDEDLYLFADNGTDGVAMLPWIWSAGGALTDPDLTTANGYLNSPETVALYTLLAELVETKCLGPSVLDVNEDAQTDFFATTVTALLAGPSIFPAAESIAPPPSFTFEAAPMPAGAAGSITVAQGFSLVVFTPLAPSDQRDTTAAALDWLRYSQSPDYQLTLAAVGHLPALATLRDSDAIQSHPTFGLFMDQLATARPLPPHPVWNQINTVLARTSANILSGEEDPQVALDLAAAEIDAILAEYR